MSIIPHIVPVSELRRDASQIVSAVNGSAEPVVITQRGRAKAVLQNIDEYQLIQRKLEIAELLAAGEADIQAGRLTSSKEVHTAAKSFLDEKRAKK